MLLHFRFLLVLLVGVASAENEDLNTVLSFFNQEDVSFLKEAENMLPVILSLIEVELKVSEGKVSLDELSLEKLGKYKQTWNRKNENFKKIANSVDAEKTHLKIIGTIRVMTNVEKARQNLLSTGDPMNPDLVRKFDNAYDEGMVIISDALFAAIFNQHKKGDQLFKVAIRVLYRHPRLSLKFMRHCVELLLHAFVLEGTHLKVLQEPDVTWHAFERRSKERLSLVVASALSLYEDLGKNIHAQIKQDQIRLHKEWQDMEHCDFAKRAKMYFADKYPQLSCFIHSYGRDLEDSLKYHSVVFSPKHASICVQVGERNSVIDCRNEDDLLPNFSAIGAKILDGVYRKSKTSKNYAKRITEKIITVMENRKMAVEQVTIVVVRAYKQGCYEAPIGHTATASKKTYKCNTDLCWVKKSYDFKVILFA